MLAKLKEAWQENKDLNITFLALCGGPVLVSSIYLLYTGAFSSNVPAKQIPVLEITSEIPIVCIGGKPYIRDEDEKYFKLPKFSGYEHIQSLCRTK